MSFFSPSCLTLLPQLRTGPRGDPFRSGSISHLFVRISIWLTGIERPTWVDQIRSRSTCPSWEEKAWLYETPKRSNCCCCSWNQGTRRRIMCVREIVEIISWKECSHVVCCKYFPFIITWQCWNRASLVAMLARWYLLHGLYSHELNSARACYLQRALKAPTCFKMKLFHLHGHLCPLTPSMPIKASHSSWVVFTLCRSSFLFREAKLLFGCTYRGRSVLHALK